MHHSRDSECEPELSIRGQVRAALDPDEAVVYAVRNRMINLPPSLFQGNCFCSSASTPIGPFCGVSYSKHTHF